MSQLGLIGIGVMGSEFAQNLAQNGHDVVLLDRNIGKVNDTISKGVEQNLKGVLSGTDDVKKFVASIKAPRAILVLVPSHVLDFVIKDLEPLLDKGDLIADLGNSNYVETERRVKELESKGLQFLGMGISGGAEGARNGPSIMSGGSKDSWALVKGPLSDASAKFEGEPCCNWFGPGGAGHFIKMLHNGIEYADMQQIAESYGMMRDGLGMSAPEIGKIFEGWMDGSMNSYLTDIAGSVAGAMDEKSGKPVLDIILDKAGQKGTGRWSVIEALHLGAPASMMQAAVEARNISGAIDTRAEMQEAFGRSNRTMDVDRTAFLADLERAMIAAKVCAYVQGFEVLERASKEFEWELDLAAIARVWRAGCIIRSVFLDEISDFFESGKGTNLSLAPVFKKRLEDYLPSLQRVVGLSVAHGLQTPALYSALSYHNMRRNSRSTANMIQGLRDYFGAHTFRRIDDPETPVNGPWHD